MDYLIADRTLIPPESRGHYLEKIVFLPDSYQANDRLKRVAAEPPARAALDLPPGSFVFCCFNNSYKITPGTFDSWMRILRRVEGSVIWLLEDSEAAARNLRREAEARGVKSERLIFARRKPLPEHLARHALADLFIDTLPYNAHTTASDALWAGLPVLTCAGESFAARVAASLLQAIGLSELIAASPEQYVAMAVELASNPVRLLALRETLRKNRTTMPLFDTERFTRHLEDAYAQMHERCQSGAGAEDIYVAR
jgi:predicted O-linked N-acetylglucosamine transferase (SPINDLY family)